MTSFWYLYCYWLELENICNTNIHKYTQQILSENDKESESVSTPISNLRHKNYETNINGHEKMSFTN